MSERIFLYNYNDEKFDLPYSVKDFKKIKFMNIKVINGDEVATIHWKNGDIETFDSAELSGEGRDSNEVDYSYVIHNMSELAEFMEREESLDYKYDF